jgi:hypothetical protein
MLEEVAQAAVRQGTASKLAARLQTSAALPGHGSSILTNDGILPLSNTDTHQGYPS